MRAKKDQHKAGIPAKPRGQQTGFAGNPDQNREEVEKTPALRGVANPQTKCSAMRRNSKLAAARQLPVQIHPRRRECASKSEHRFHRFEKRIRHESAKICGCQLNRQICVCITDGGRYRANQACSG